jgi:hypothetical protein
MLGRHVSDAGHTGALRSQIWNGLPASVPVQLLAHDTT